MQREVEPEGAEGAAHSRALRAPNGFHHPIHHEEARALHSVEEVEEGRELRAALLHRVQHRLPGECVESVAEVGLEDNVALFPERPEGVAERLRPSLGHAGLQWLKRTRCRPSRGGAHSKLEGPLEEVAAHVHRAQGGREALGRGLGLLRGVQLVQRDEVAAGEDVSKGGRHLHAGDAGHESRQLVDEGNVAPPHALAAQREQEPRAPAEAVRGRFRAARELEEQRLRLPGSNSELRHGGAVLCGGFPGRMHAAEDVQRLARVRRAAVGEHLLHRAVAPVLVRFLLGPAQPRVPATLRARRVRVRIGRRAPGRRGRCRLVCALALLVLRPEAGTVLAQHERRQLDEVEQGLRERKLVTAVERVRKRRCEALARVRPRPLHAHWPRTCRGQPAEHARVSVHLRQPCEQLSACRQRGQPGDASWARGRAGTFVAGLRLGRLKLRQRELAAGDGEVLGAGLCRGFCIHRCVGQAVRLAVEFAPHMPEVQLATHRLQRLHQRKGLLGERPQTRVRALAAHEHDPADQLRVARDGEQEACGGGPALRHKVTRELQAVHQRGELGDVVRDVSKKGRSLGEHGGVRG